MDKKMKAYEVYFLLPVMKNKQWTNYAPMRKLCLEFANFYVFFRTFSR
jgi:hypothetical protein